jgi:hypothetical protein
VPGAWLALAAVAAYAGTFTHGFVWDDDLHVTANPTIIGPLGLREIWTSARANYFPLVLTNFWLQHAAWGLNPAGYHVITVVCHAVSAVLLWRVLAALCVPGAGIGAALWALHPVQVESVAWISELKRYPVGGFLPAGGTRVRAVAGCAAGREGGAGLVRPDAGVRGDGADEQAVHGHAAGGARAHRLVAARRTARPRGGGARAVLPLSALVSGWTIWEQKFHSGAIGAEWSQTGVERGLIAGRIIWFYLGKLIWPDPLIFIYPRWKVQADAFFDWLPLILLVMALGVLWRGRHGALRPVGLAALYFGALLFPVLGFFNVYFFRYSFVGDHFQYLASMGPLALAGAGVARLPRRVGIPLAAGLLAVCGALDRAAGPRIYQGHVALWSATVAKNPGAAMAWMNLADSLSKEGRHEEAIVALKRGLALKADEFDGYNDLGCEQRHRRPAWRGARAVRPRAPAPAGKPDDAQQPRQRAVLPRSPGRGRRGVSPGAGVAAGLRRSAQQPRGGARRTGSFRRGAAAL